MARIGVYVPDERMPEIEQWREEMNFSQLFIEAFDRAVAAQAAVSKVKGKEMKGVIERLRKAADGTYEAGWKQGAKLGREWAVKHAYLSHLRKIGEGEMTFSKADDSIKGFLRHHYEDCGYILTPEEENDEYYLERFNDADMFRRGENAGFVEAVKHVWADIKPAFDPPEAN